MPYGTGQQSHSISSNSFITAPYYVQPIKVILREVSTNTDSDWNETSGSEKDTVSFMLIFFLLKSINSIGAYLNRLERNSLKAYLGRVIFKRKFFSVARESILVIGN